MDKEIIIKELKFKAVRSSGAGGQNVNKVSSKVILSFDLLNSKGFSEEEMSLLSSKLATKINLEGILQISCEEDRSQLKNKATAIEKLFELLEKSLAKPKQRKATKTPKSAVEKRLKEKKSNSEVKNSRKKLDF
ncbi:MAG: alternative ribosome rescue aminoacyl-tRNA hydrolase ArfB [Limnohabitans sp.]|nr:alternative ribosome rescue aminoacyl-tRNA hydrolase ArfB [Limnohabitans sp.]